jgi:DNA polymerase III alpha subunit
MEKRGNLPLKFDSLGLRKLIFLVTIQSYLNFAETIAINSINFYKTEIFSMIYDRLPQMPSF